MKKIAILLLLVPLLFPVISLAQGLGSLVGTVTDPSGSTVASAAIKVTAAGTGLSRTSTTNAEGLFLVPSLRPSTYDVIIEARGFATYRQNGITLLADQTLTLNARLKL